MSFISFAFLSLFLVVFACRLLIGRNKTEHAYLAVLIASSILFYAWHVPWYLIILFISIVVDFLAGGAMDRLPSESPRRKWLLVLSVVTNLGLLGFFKYADFLMMEFDRFLIPGPPLLPRFETIMLPIGISFYTFQSMSYTIDIYRGRLRPARNFWHFLLFVTFFPQLVAGPIVRAKEFLYQIGRKRRLSMRVMGEGFFLIIRGFFLKMVIADNVAVYVDRNWDVNSSSGALMIATFLFSTQIFCDFAGYSSIARGLGYVLGFRIPKNFDSPYIATSFSNFWQRWHITLSQWLRDYLYIPLGGNRVSRARTYVNLMLVMLLGGLWHGAATTFVLWGALHGTALAVERAAGVTDLLQGPGKRALKFGWYLVVQVMVLVTWIVFRSQSGEQAVGIVRKILEFNVQLGPVDEMWPVLFVIPMVLMHLRQFLHERGLFPTSGPKERAILAGVMFVAILIFYGQDNAFIYFQF